MSSLRILSISMLALAGVSLSGGVARAQEPDLREIRPVVMLVVDTSGSSERVDGTGQLPRCGGVAGTDERNRWSTVLEAMTGTWPSFACTAVDRRGFVGAVDRFYRLPYHRPPIGSPQDPNGILDIYRERVKFGLMTSDGYYGLLSVHPTLVRNSVFLSRLLENQTAGGEYSYGNTPLYTFPNCGVPHMVDAGVRNERAPAGRLVSVGTEADDFRLINQDIQDSLLAVRPYGGTPMEAMLDDLRYYLNNHSDVRAGGDPFALCRRRYAVVLSDGGFDSFYREGAASCQAAGMTCPYQRASTTAADLCRYDAGAAQCRGVLDGLFVVALNPEGGNVATLNDLAVQGGTRRAFLATDYATLVAALSAVLDQAAPQNTTRTTPSFGQSSTGFSATAGGAGAAQTQFQMTSGFNLSNDGTPWSGVLERTRFVCGPSLDPVAQPIDPSQGDRFDVVLDRRDLGSNPRRLYTVVTPRATQMTGEILGAQDGLAPVGGVSPPGSAPRGLDLVPFRTANVDLTDAHLGISGGSVAARAARRQATIRWVHGETRTRRLGDIYHSSPVIASPPRVDIADEGYTAYRQRADVRDRPTVTYVGTNDGILHAFAVENYRSADGSVTVSAGEEIWGFVPPYVVPRLEAASAAHQVLVDGTPVVHDIFYARRAGDPVTADPAARQSYRRVLVMGLRGGGSAYFALDVTDPINPVFLWQFTTSTMGTTYGRPAIGQVFVRVGGTLEERAVAILPGGNGDIDTASARTTGPVGCPARGIGTPPVTGGTTNARSRQRCWGRIGRELHWVDLATGLELVGFDDRTFNAPLTGGVSLFTGDTGTIATRAFVTDADGVVWRIDMSSPNMASWTARPFHDIFWDGPAIEGQPAYEPPVVTVDDNGQVVVIVATGDIDRLDSTAANRIVSLTERLTRTGATVTASTDLNWEIRLRPGEQVTGPLSLFESNVYFGTFFSNPSSCDYGTSAIWGVHFLNAGPTVTPPAGYTSPVAGRFPMPGLESTAGIGRLDAHLLPVGDNQIVMGVAVTQRPTCIQGDTIPDPYMGGRWEVQRTGGGDFQLVAQVSGRGGAAGVGAPRVASIQRTLPAPEAFTRILAVAPQADF